MDQVVYVKIKKKVEVNKRKIKLIDIADISCADKKIYNQLQECEIYEFMGKEKKQEYVGDVIKVIDAIHLGHPTLEVTSIGESDFIIDYASKHKTESTSSKIYLVLKVCIVGVMMFLGAAFSIISFHKDAQVQESLDFIYEMFTGIHPNGPTLIDIAYAIGLTVGIIVFFNHTFKYKITDEPTPLEVELTDYEDKLENAVIDKNSTTSGE